MKGGGGEGGGGFGRLNTVRIIQCVFSFKVYYFDFACVIKKIMPLFD